MENVMKQFLSKFFDKTFWKFILVGIANTVFGYGISLLFLNVFHLGLWISSAADYVFGSILSYFLNKFFTFESKGNTKKTIIRFTINIVVCYVVSLGIAQPLVEYILKSQTEFIRDNCALLVSKGLFIALNYVGQRFFVFKETENIDK